jgi:hypothetical protein
MEARRLGGRLNTVIALGLAAGRLTLGAGIWGAPRPALAALGFDADEAQARTLGRLVATRDLTTGALAVATLNDPAAARRIALANAVIDAGDVAAFAVALRERGSGQAHGAALGIPGALLASAAGAFLAWRLSSLPEPRGKS